MRTSTKIGKTEGKGDVKKDVNIKGLLAESVKVSLKSDRLLMPQKRKTNCQVEDKGNNSDIENNLYKPKKARKPHITLLDLPCDHSSAINVENVKEVFNPKPDGFCRYRSIAYALWGRRKVFTGKS